MVRSWMPDWPPPWPQDLPLADRTRQALADFDAQPKDYAFADSGDGTAYASWFADLLDEWLAADHG